VLASKIVDDSGCLRESRSQSPRCKIRKMHTPVPTYVASGRSQTPGGRRLKAGAFGTASRAAAATSAPPIRPTPSGGSDGSTEATSVAKTMVPPLEVEFGKGGQGYTPDSTKSDLNPRRPDATEPFDEEAMPMDEIMDFRHPTSMMRAKEKTFTVSQPKTVTPIASSTSRLAKTPKAVTPIASSTSRLAKAPKAVTPIASSTSRLATSPKMERAKQRLRKQVANSSPPKTSADQPPVQAIDAADRGGGAGLGDDVSTLGGGIEDDASTIVKLTQAFQQPLPVRPPNLNPSEQALWHAVQAKIKAVQDDSSLKCRKLEQQIHNSTSQLGQARQNEKKLEDQLQAARRQLDSLKDKDSSSPGTCPTGIAAKDSLKIKRLEGRLAKAEELYKEAQEKASQEEAEHEKTVRSIQRVLADLSREKDTIVEDLTSQLERLKEKQQNQRDRSVLEFEDELMATRGERSVMLEVEANELKLELEKSKKSTEGLQQALEKKSGKLSRIERDLTVAKRSLGDIESKKDELAASLKEKTQLVEQLEKDLVRAKSELEEAIVKEQQAKNAMDFKEKQISKLKRHLRALENGHDVSFSQTDSDAEEIAFLKKQVNEKEASLESAKKIIVSLETANGSLADNLREKLKDKDEKILTLEAEGSDRQRKLDHLAIELQEAQLARENLEQSAKQQRVQQKVLAEELEKALSDLQAASAVHEAMATSGAADEETFDEISQVLNTALVAIRLANSEKVRDALVEGDNMTDIVSDVGSVSSELNRQLDAIIQSDREAAAQGLRRELEEKTNMVQRLEETLQKNADELERLRCEMRESAAARDAEETKLNAEVSALQQQLSASMETLSKKELALEVLRASLETKNDVGSISEESDEEKEGTSTKRPSTPSKNDRSTSEAIAAVLAKGGSGIDVASSVTLQELNKCRTELAFAQEENERATKELNAEKDNLANAKMIISSLERANKNMIEDLRQRLQDSNKAISSLLDQSHQHEKSSAELKDELEKLKAEKEKQAKEYEAEMEKLKDKEMVTSLRLAAKEREIKEMRIGESGTKTAKNDTKLKGLGERRTKSEDTDDMRSAREEEEGDSVDGPVEDKYSTLPERSILSDEDEYDD
jgi:hypothetical protein